MVINHEEGKKSQTTYKVIESVGKEMALVELNPITGRTHQLRVHMAAINCPIVGDRKYGGKEAVVDGISQKLHLHAYKLSLPFIKKNFKAPLPEHIAKTLKYIGVDVP